MDGVEENGGLILKYMLGTVSMMDVEIDNTDTLYIPFHLQVAGSDGNIVEKTESKGSVRFSVMTRRSDSTESVVDLPFHNEPHGFNDPAYSKHGDIEGIFANLIVWMIEFAHIKQTCFFKPHDMLGRMNCFYPFLLRPDSFDKFQVGKESCFLDSLVCSKEPLWAFGMIGPGTME